MLAVYPLATRPLLGTQGVQTVAPAGVVPDEPPTLWPVDPNWVASYQVQLEFQTAVSVSRSGREQRIARRHTPRKRIEYRALVHADSLRRYKDLLWHRHPRQWVLPELTRAASLPEALPAGEATLPWPEAPAWVRPGGVLVLGARDGEALRVGGLEGDLVHLRDAPEQDWPTGAAVYPGLTGHLAMSLDADRRTSDVAEPEIRFAVLPLSEVPREPAEPELMFEDREVFLGKPNWAQSVSSSLGHEVDELDYGTGPITRYIAQQFGTEVTEATHTCTTADEAEALVDLFLRLRGQQGEAWVPTWEADFRLAETVGSGSDRFPVDDPDLVARYDDSPTHQAVFVRLTDGTLLLRRVLGVTAAGEGSEIVVDTPWGVELTPSNVAMAGWLLLRRLASDRLTLEWLTNGVAQVVLNWRSVEALPADDLEEAS